MHSAIIYSNSLLSLTWCNVGGGWMAAILDDIISGPPSWFRLIAFLNNRGRIWWPVAGRGGTAAILDDVISGPPSWISGHVTGNKFSKMADRQ